MQPLRAVRSAACRTKHQWMAFIDVDEFLVITDPTVSSLPQLLRDYTDYGALAVNWQVHDMHQAALLTHELAPGA